MGCAPSQRKVKGTKLEKYVTDELRNYGFDAEHVGGSWDGGVDVLVKLFGELRTVQCASWGNRTFSFSKLFDKLRRAQIAVFLFEGYKDPLVITPLPAWMDHLTWEKPGRDHSRAQLRAFLASKGMRSDDIEKACQLV